jgi:hypothetical protein
MNAKGDNSYGNPVQKNGFIYTYKEDNPTEACIVAFPQEKTVTVPKEIDGKTVTKIDLLYPDEYSFMYGYEPGYQDPIVEVLSIPETVNEININGGWLNEGSCDGMQSQLMYLKKFKVSSKNEKFASYKGILYSKDKKTLISVPRMYETKTVSLPGGVKTIKDSAFSFCTNIATVKLPSTVTSIEQHAFYRCSLNSINLPQKLTSIGVEAFSYSNIKKITIKGNVKKIANGAFDGCKKLKSVVIKEGVKSIECSAFYNCTALRTISIPKSVTKLDQQCFDLESGKPIKKNLSHITVVTPKNSQAYKYRNYWKKWYQIKVKVSK